MNLRYLATALLLLASLSTHAGPYYVTGKVTSLLASGSSPAIRLTGNISPDLCDGGPNGWLSFVGTPEQQARIYSTALAMALSGHTVTVYTNTDGATCPINNIQIISGLN